MPSVARAHDRKLAAVAATAIVAAGAATSTMWRTAVDWRATTGDGHILGWAIPSSVLAVVLALWLITACLDRGRARAVALLSTALVAVALGGWFAVVAATSEVTLG